MTKKRSKELDLSWKVVIRDIAVAALDAAKANPIMAASVGSFPFSCLAVALGTDKHFESRIIVNAHWDNARNMTFPQIATPLFNIGGSMAPSMRPTGVTKPYDVAGVGELLKVLLKK